MDPDRGGAEPAENEAARLLDVVAAVAREARPQSAAQPALDTSLERELGLDSLARVELVLRLERRFGTSLPEQALATCETPRDLLRFLRAARGHAPQAADPDAARTAPAQGVAAPEQLQTLGEVLEYHAERQPDRLAVHLYEEGREHTITYGALREGSLGYAARLVQLGLEPGHRVAIMLPTGLAYLHAFYGVMLAGGVPVPLYPPARMSTIEDHMARHVGILKSAAASLMITVPEAKPLAYLLRAQVPSLRAVLVPADLALPGAEFAPVRGNAGDIAFLQYTSGSTGHPKGVVLTHANILANVRAAGRALSAAASDVFVSWLPLYHDMGLIGGCFATLVHGFPVVLMSPLAFLVRPSQWLRAIHRHGGTISGGPNFAYELCLRRIPDEDMQGIDLASWRFAFNGAEPVSPATMSAFAERFARWGFRRNAMCPVYGLAECTVGLATAAPGQPWRMDVIDRETFSRDGLASPARPQDPAPLTVVGCGQVFPGHELRVVDGAGRELPDRREGRLQFRGPSATSGYYRNPEATKTLFDGDWLNTGDRAYLCDGVLFITGREKDLIIRGGRNISPYELEHAVGALSGIRRGCVAVFGVADARSGTERVVVVAELRSPGASDGAALRGQINAIALDLIGGPPDEIVLAPAGAVPKTSSGKIRRAAAREFYAGGRSLQAPRAAWLQFLRLGLRGGAHQLRRTLAALADALFALRGACAFGLVFPIAFVAARAVPAPRCWNLGRRLARGFFAAAGIRVVARGLDALPRGRAVILAVNHTSYLDALVLLSLLEYRGWAFVAKREFEHHALMGPLLAGFGTLFVERYDVAKSAEHAGELAEAAKRGVSLIVFPEGTLRRAAGLRPFRAGAFQAAVQARVPVVPVAIRGARSALRDGTWFLRRYPVAVSFGEPLAPDGEDWLAAVRLRDRVRAEILGRCGEPDLLAE